MFSDRVVYGFAVALATVLNLDLVVLPHLHLAGLQFVPLFLAGVLIGTPGLCFWYWFLGWIRTKKTRKDSSWLSRRLRAERLRCLRVERGKTRKVKVLLWIARWTGPGVLLWLVSAEPLPGTRVVGVILCRSWDWKVGFYILLLGNIFHLPISIKLWVPLLAERYGQLYTQINQLF